MTNFQMVKLLYCKKIGMVRSELRMILGRKHTKQVFLIHECKQDESNGAGPPLQERQRGHGPPSFLQSFL